MIEAMKQYNDIAESSTKNSPPKVLLIVTGDFAIVLNIVGKADSPELKAFYEEEMRKLDLKYVVMTTMWLEPGDYPLLLGSSDLGM